ncbi:acyltransferase family protein [Pseudorhodoferax sp.]|uniref:acyltransferase family protein n=1 Tax=Pseudorhodoferax sp. TaxID=1993553 RepID=UPI0039E650DE
MHIARPSEMSPALSVYLDLLRFLAAAAVFLLHAGFHRISGGLPGLWHLSVFGDDAVMLFFVLSGFVIAHVAARGENRPAPYLAARLARLWSVCVPALALTAALDAVGMRLAPQLYAFELYEYSHPAARLAACLLFLHELWFWSIQPFTNTPYWSIGYEFWYYLLFAAALFTRGRRRVAAVALVALAMGPKIALLLPVWLGGVWACRTPLADRLPRPAAVALCTATLALYLAYRFSLLQETLDALTLQWIGPVWLARLGFSQHFLANYLVGTLVTLHFVGARRLLRDAAAPPAALERPIRWLAGLTFALYLFHQPLLQFFGALADGLGLVEQRRLLVVLGPLPVVALLGPLAERGKAPLRRWLMRMAGR